MSPSSASSLQGVRVLDLSRVLAGPWCTQMLGDLGADIIKVEKPGQGDDTRQWGPPFDAHSGQSAYFQCANRNKRSLALDFAHPEGAALLRRLAGHCDVVVENFKPGSLDRYGLAPAQLLAEHPRLVVCSISGFGHTGPLSKRAGYDFVVQAMGGLMSITGPAPNEPGSGAYKTGVAVADLFTGLHAAVAILAALRHRDLHGEGQHIDLALYDCQLAMLANVAQQALCSGEAPLRQGNRHASIAPYETLPCADGELVLAVGNDDQFRRCCVALDAPGLGEDPRFQTNPLRLRHREALREQLGMALRFKTRAHCLALLETAGVPAASVQTVPEALLHPQARAREMLQPLDPGAPSGALGVASPLKLSKTPTRQSRRPPALGEHGSELLAEFGVGATEQRRLLDAGVLAPPENGVDRD